MAFEAHHKPCYGNLYLLHVTVMTTLQHQTLTEMHSRAEKPSSKELNFTESSWVVIKGKV